jgi:hypothetical protein
MMMASGSPYGTTHPPPQGGILFKYWVVPAGRDGEESGKMYLVHLFKHAFVAVYPAPLCTVLQLHNNTILRLFVAVLISLPPLPTK